MPRSTASASVNMGNIDQMIQRIWDQGLPLGDRAANALQQYLYPWSDPNSPFFQNPNLDINRVNQQLQDFAQNGGALPSNLQQLIDQNNQASRGAQGIVDAGGRTDTSRAAFDALQSILNGSNKNIAGMSDLAKTLTANRGFTGDMSTALAQAMDIIKSRGQTDQTRQMFQQGSDLISSGGFTSQMTGLMSQIQDIISGKNPGAVLPLSVGTSFAKDSAAAATAAAAESARRGAFQRLGAASGSGSVESALAEFGDEQARNEAAGIQQATGTYQQLKLQQLMGALTQGNELTKTGAANISTGAGLESSAGSLANQLFSGGTQLFNQTNQLAQNNMSMGGDLLAKILSAQGGAAGGLTSLAGTENSAVSDALARIAQLSSSSGGIIDSNNRNVLASLGQQSSNINDFSRNFLTGAAQLGGLQSNWLSLLPSLYGAFGNVAGDQVNNANYSPWASILASLGGSAIGGAAGGLGTGLGGIIAKSVAGGAAGAGRGGR